jgi:hypothetical protein
MILSGSPSPAGYVLLTHFYKLAETTCQEVLTVSIDPPFNAGSSHPFPSLLTLKPLNISDGSAGIAEMVDVVSAKVVGRYARRGAAIRSSTAGREIVDGPARIVYGVSCYRLDKESIRLYLSSEQIKSWISLSYYRHRPGMR